MLCFGVVVQCVFDYAKGGHFISACFKFTFGSSFGVCHCKSGRNTIVLATTGSPGCGLFATCTNSKPTRCKQKVLRPTETVFADSAIKQTTEKKNRSSATLVFVLENHIDLLSDDAHFILDDKPSLHRTASLFPRHPHKVYNYTSVFQQRDHL